MNFVETFLDCFILSNIVTNCNKTLFDFKDNGSAHIILTQDIAAIQLK